ncbi:MAG: T9SS type A sorting domain-containing protein [Bacteroidota bacterium]
MRIIQHLLLIAFIGFSQFVYATHNIAGEITYTHSGNLIVEFRVSTFTKLSSVPADRDSLHVCFGDGVCKWALRINGPDIDMDDIPDGEIVSASHKMSIYSTDHTYQSNGQYTVSMTDPNRNGGIMNILNSANTPFHLETTFNLDAAVPDNSPVMLEFPIDKGVVGEPFTHIPNAFDSDGDSLSFKEIIPLQDINTEISSYWYVDELMPGPNNQVFLDHEFGLFDWSAPQAEGAYTVAILVESYRNGVLMSSIIRDMQIDIYEAENFPPDCIINTPGVNENTAMMVSIGDTVRLEITASEVEGQLVDLTATSGLFSSFNQNAEFVVSSSGNTSTGHLEWIVDQEHVRDQPYMFVFKAKNNNPSSELAAFRKVRYLVSDMTTSIEQVEPETPSINVFPNPVGAGRLLHIQWESQFAPSSFTIFDQMGRIIRQGKLDNADQRLSTNGLLQGLFLLKIDHSENKSQVVPFLVK